MIRVPVRKAGVMLAAAVSPLLHASETLAAEGATSHYLPGAVGDLGFAIPPEPGWLVANTTWFQSGNVSTAVVNGDVGVSLDLSVVLNMTALTYTFEQQVLGGTYTVGAILPFGRTDLDATIGSANPLRFSDRVSGLSDIALIPLQISWASGNLAWSVSETITAPTGEYDADEDVSLGLNYWTFDTAAAFTYFNPETGFETSVSVGVMAHTKNGATDYQTGAEFHLDWVANQFVSDNLAIGPRGYVYQQLTGDSGAGAVLGDFKSSSFGLGLGFMRVPPAGDGNLIVAGKWMRDLEAKNRFKSDYAQVTLAWQF